MRQTRRSRSILSHNHQGRRPRRPTREPEPQRRRTAPTPPTQPAGADVQEAEAGGALFSQLNLKRSEKERFRQFVKNEPRVSRRYGCRFFLAFFCNLLIFLKFRFLFCFRKQKIKGGKEKKEILFGGKDPPMAGAILMFLKSSRASSFLSAKSSFSLLSS